MYKQIMEKVATAGTVALLGYEIGANTHESEKNTNNTVHEEKHSEVIVIGVIVLIIVALVILAKIYKNKRLIV